MSLIRLTYTSIASEEFRPGDLGDIVASSQRNNRRDAITGFLSYAAPQFTQCLEGERGTVLAVYERIAADRRHSDIRVLAMRNVDAREFSDWAMQLVHLEGEALEAVMSVLQKSRAEAGTWAETAVEERLVRLVRGLYASPRANAKPVVDQHRAEASLTARESGVGSVGSR